MHNRLAALAILLIAPVVAAQSAAIDVELEDQFEKTRSLKSFFKVQNEGKQPVVIVAGDRRQTGEAIQKWVEGLAEPLAGKARVLGLVDLDDVPFFVPNSAIRSDLAEMFPKDVVILCDWDGKAYQRIGFSEGALVEVAVYDPTGKRVAVVKRAFNAGDRQHVLRAVRQALATLSESSPLR